MGDRGEMVRTTRQQVKYGAGTVKLEASGTGISPYSDSRKQTMSVAEMAAAVEEAHRNGVVVACHAQATEAIKNAVRAGVDPLEHGTFPDGEGPDMMVTAGTRPGQYRRGGRTASDRRSNPGRPHEQAPCGPPGQRR